MTHLVSNRWGSSADHFVSQIIDSFLTHIEQSACFLHQLHQCLIVAASFHLHLVQFPFDMLVSSISIRYAAIFSSYTDHIWRSNAFLFALAFRAISGPLLDIEPSDNCSSSFLIVYWQSCFRTYLPLSKIRSFLVASIFVLL